MLDFMFNPLYWNKNHSLLICPLHCIALHLKTMLFMYSNLLIVHNGGLLKVQCDVRWPFVPIQLFPSKEMNDLNYCLPFSSEDFRLTAARNILKWVVELKKATNSMHKDQENKEMTSNTSADEGSTERDPIRCCAAKIFGEKHLCIHAKCRK